MMLRQFFVPLTLMLLACAAVVIVVSSPSHSADPPSGPTADGAAKNLEAEMIRRNGAIFEGWTPPKVALVFTGLLDGYIEPCGCSGKENQKGGLSRRDMLLKRLAGEKWPLVALDLGDQVKRFGRQQELKFQAAADGLKEMGYQAIGLGPDDLRLSAGERVG